MSQKALEMLVVDNDFRNLNLPLSVEERKLLEDDIKKSGCRDPIDVWKHKGQMIIVDGHTRYEICQNLGRECGKRELEFGDRDEVKTFIVQSQLGRRNLSTAQRAVLALRLKDQVGQAAKKRQQLSKGAGRKGHQISDDLSGTTLEILAGICGVSHDTLYRVDKILSEGDVKLREDLERGEISVNAAYSKLSSPHRSVGSRRKKTTDRGAGDPNTEPVATPDVKHFHADYEVVLIDLRFLTGEVEMDIGHDFFAELYRQTAGDLEDTSAVVILVVPGSFVGHAAHYLDSCLKLWIRQVVAVSKNSPTPGNYFSESADFMLVAQLNDDVRVVDNIDNFVEERDLLGIVEEVFGRGALISRASECGGWDCYDEILEPVIEAVSREENSVDDDGADRDEDGKEEDEDEESDGEDEGEDEEESRPNRTERRVNKGSHHTDA